ncbi:MAG: glycosyltransferase [Planctomycetota bacterium]
MFNAPHVVLAGADESLHAGMAIARHIEQRLPNAQITLAGDGKAAQRHAVRDAGYGYMAMPGKPRPVGPLQTVRYVTDNVAGYWASRWTICEQKVSLVIGMGGPASSGMLRAAHSRGVPFILVEQDAVPSPLHRRLAPSAEAVCGAFEQTRAYLPIDAPFSLTGVPGRASFERLAAARPTRRSDSSDRKRLVVIEGAGPAGWLNAACPAALSQLQEQLRGWQVVHQSGRGQLEETERRHRASGADTLVVSYIDEMASLLAETDLVVCRAGGGVLAELALAAAPAVLAPGAEGRQAENARLFSHATGCPVVEAHADADRLAGELQRELATLLIDGTRRGDISDAVAGAARPNASRDIAQLACDALCGAPRRLAA